MRASRVVSLGVGVVGAAVLAGVLAPPAGRSNKVDLSYAGPDAPCVTGSPDLDPRIYVPTAWNKFWGNPRKVKWQLASNTCKDQDNGRCYWKFEYVADPNKGKVSGNHLGAVPPIECNDESTESKVDKEKTHPDADKNAEGFVEWPYKIKVFKCKLVPKNPNNPEGPQELAQGDPLCELDPRVWIK